MKKVYGYIRVSTKEQEEGASLDTQQEAIINYANRKGFQIIQWFEEKQTANKTGRPLFRQMLKNLKANKADGAIIFKVDRSSRNLREWEDLKDIAKTKEIHFANDFIDLRTNSGVLTGDVMAVIASNYINNMLEDSRRGFYGRLKQGLYPLKAPVGYMDNGKGKVKTLDPEKAPLVKKMFELYAYGNYSVEELREKMYQLGLRNNGKAYVLSFFFKTLHNPFYTGVIKIKTTGETFAGIHEPLISQQLFNQVQRKLKGKQVLPRKRQKFMFTKLLKCRCGYTLIPEKQKQFVYYRCHRKTCPETAIREDRVFWIITRAVRAIDWSFIDRMDIKQALESIVDTDQEERIKQKKSMELMLVNNKSRQDKLLDMYIDSNLEKEDFEKKKEELVLQQREYTEQLESLSGNDEEISRTLSFFLEQCKSLYISYLGADIEKKRSIAKNLFSNLELRAGKLEISTNFPYSLWENHPSFLYCGLSRQTPRTDQRYYNTYSKKFIAEQIAHFALSGKLEKTIQVFKSDM